MTNLNKLTLAETGKGSFIIADLYGESLEFEIKPTKTKHRKTADGEQVRQMASRIVQVFQAMEVLRWNI